MLSGSDSKNETTIINVVNENNRLGAKSKKKTKENKTAEMAGLLKFLFF